MGETSPPVEETLAPPDTERPAHAEAGGAGDEGSPQQTEAWGQLLKTLDEVMNTRQAREGMKFFEMRDGDLHIAITSPSGQSRSTRRAMMLRASMSPCATVAGALSP